MTKAQSILTELQSEIETTRKFLALVPLDKGDWKPHEKSMTLARLATHVAEIPSWFHTTMVEDELDFAKSHYTPPVVNSNEDLVQLMETNLTQAKAILAEFPDEKFQENWTMRAGDQIYSVLSKDQAVRKWCLSHWYHHRAQLGVYLRLLDIPIPGSYGPSADSNN